MSASQKIFSCSRISFGFCLGILTLTSDTDIYHAINSEEAGLTMRHKINTHRIDPVCRFGPGGDFIQPWPAKPEDYLQQSQSPLARLLYSISRIINTTEHAPVIAGTAENHNMMEHDENAKSQEIAHRHNAATTANSKSDSDFQGQILLFANDCRAVGTVEHKPKHSIRAHRRTAKKRPPLRIAGQGSLFEADAQSAKTA
jgi:hypothetical protein